jgi:NTE family protein
MAGGGGGQGLVLALGGGGAKGLAHIGVLAELHAQGIPVRAVAGTSVGAEIGAFFATGMPIEALQEVATGFDWIKTLRLFFPDLPTGGIASGASIMDFLTPHLGERRIEDLEIGFVAIATDLETGEQVVLDRGSLSEAVRASVSLPGLFAPFRIGNRLLVDGGVVNPVPIDVARERFGGPVLGVAVHAGARGLSKREMQVRPSSQWRGRVRQLLQQPWLGPADGLRVWLNEQLQEPPADGVEAWGTRRVLDQVIGIGEAQITQLRAQRHPPDLMLTPDVHDIGMIEFYRATDAIDAGRRAVQAEIEAIRKLISE